MSRRGRLTKTQLQAVVDLYEEVIMDVVADLADGEDAQQINANIHRKMQRIQLEYFGEII